MASALNHGDLVTLRNRFKKGAEFLLQTSEPEEREERDKGPEQRDMKPLPRINRHSVFWIAAAVAVTYYVDFFSLLLHSDNINRWWLNVGLLLLSLCLSLALFCIVYLEWFKGISHYDQEYPAVPAITTAAFIAASCSLNLALWPLWSFLTPLLLFTQFMGAVMFVSLLG
ncbi:hypothetical protein NQD34_002980 [Periophthalmus magnuspinnatus]|nr:hypothetical protein NQD34_002980 [Periophthalmus magnuspinnatus]